MDKHTCALRAHGPVRACTADEGALRLACSYCLYVVACGRARPGPQRECVLEACLCARRASRPWREITLASAVVHDVEAALIYAVRGQQGIPNLWEGESASCLKKEGGGG